MRATLLRLAAYGLVVAMSAFGLWRIDKDAKDDEAARCVAAWDTREDIRQAIAGAATVPVEALIAVLPQANPEQVAAYRDETAHRIAAATDEITDPTCDLEAAKERVG